MERIQYKQDYQQKMYLFKNKVLNFYLLKLKENFYLVKNLENLTKFILIKVIHYH